MSGPISDRDLSNLVSSTQGSSPVQGASGVTTPAAAKDVISSASGQAETITISFTIPRLAEGQPISSVGAFLEKGPSLLALVAEIALLQSKAGIDSWKAMYDMQSNIMNYTVKLAPVQAAAIRNQYAEQAHATRTQAQEALVTGIVNMAAFALTVGLGVGSVLSETETAGKDAVTTTLDKDAAAAPAAQAAAAAAPEAVEEGAAAATTGVQQVSAAAREEAVEEGAAIAAEEGTAGAAATPAPAATEAAQEGAAGAEQASAATREEAVEERAAIAAEEGTAGAAAKPSAAETAVTKGTEPPKPGQQAEQAKNFFQRNAGFFKGLGKVMEVGNFVGMGTQGITSMIKYHYENKVAAIQIQIGNWESCSKQLDTTTSFYQQAYGRCDAATQGQQQAINQAVDFLRQMTDAIVNAISQGFNKVA